MKCTSCQRDNSDDAGFCSGCGSRLALVCPSCARANASDAAFCSGCGGRLLEAPHTPSPQPSPVIGAQEAQTRAPALRARQVAPLPVSFADGRYQIKSFLGEGGRKRVYLAHDTKLDSDVAIAVIKTEGLDSDSLTRIRREAQAMGRLRDHPHIVTVHDIGDEIGRAHV